MDFSLSETQAAVAEAADGIFSGLVDADRVRSVEAGAERVDRELLAALGAAELLGLAVPAEHGGGGLGMLEVCLVLEAAGRVVAPVPLREVAALAAPAIARHGSAGLVAEVLPGLLAGTQVATAALAGIADQRGRGVAPEPTVAGSVQGDGTIELTGRVTAVPAGHVASCVLVPVRVDGRLEVVSVDPSGPGCTAERAECTNRQIATHLAFDRAPVPADRVLSSGGAGGEEVVAELLVWADIASAAIALGVCEAALAQTADYLNQREQFGRPLSAFQGTMLRAADAAIDIEAMRVTLLQAAWRHDEGLDAGRAAGVATWWAREGASRVVHATQHLHGGMGADVDYPIHRYFLWGKQLELEFGGPSAQVARLGRVLVEDLRNGRMVPA